MSTIIFTKKLCIDHKGVTKMKKLFFLLVIMLLISSSFCFADDIFSNQNDNISDSEMEYWLVLFLLIPVLYFIGSLPYKMLSITQYDSKKKYEVKLKELALKEKYIDGLNKQLACGEITHEKYEQKCKEILESIEIVSQQTVVQKKRAKISIPSRCSPNTDFPIVKSTRRR